MTIDGRLNGVYEKTNQTSNNKPVYKPPYTEMYLYYHGTTWYMGASIGTFKAKNLVNEQYLPYNKQMYIYTYILNSFYDDMNKFAGQCGLR